MKKYLIITADTNDADYVREKTEITDEELEVITPVIEAIKAYDNDKTIKYQKWNWWRIDNSYRDNPTPEKLYVENGKCTQEALEIFESYVPSGGDNGVHTIESIELLEVVNEIQLL